MALAGGAWAQTQEEVLPDVPQDRDAAPSSEPALETWQNSGRAELQTLDKINARPANIMAVLGQPVQYGTLSITVRACRTRGEGQTPETVAWMEIVDTRGGGAAPVFKGWMFASAPAASMLQHPLYDVRVLGCQAATQAPAAVPQRRTTR